MPSDSHKEQYDNISDTSGKFSIRIPAEVFLQKESHELDTSESHELDVSWDLLFSNLFIFQTYTAYT